MTTTASTSGTYGATFNWTIPTQRQNGQALLASELSGYEIYYTTDDPAVTGSIKVSGGTTSSYSVSNLAAGNYYFAISALDSTGVKSPLSSVVAVTLGAASSTVVGATSSTSTGSSSTTGATTSTGTSATSTTGGTTATTTGTSSTTSSTATSGATTASSTSTASYSAKLSWTIPTTRANGQALLPSELSGYEISYVLGGVAGTTVVKVSGGSTSSYVLSGLKKGIYGFTVTAIDVNGVRSAASSRFLAGVGYASSTTATASTATTTSAATGS